MSSNTSDGTPQMQEQGHNGSVTLTIEVSDPQGELGILTEVLDVDVDGSKMSERLWEHIWNNHHVEVDEYADVEVIE